MREGACLQDIFVKMSPKCMLTTKLSREATLECFLASIKEINSHSKLLYNYSDIKILLNSVKPTKTLSSDGVRLNFTEFSEKVSCNPQLPILSGL